MSRELMEAYSKLLSNENLSVVYSDTATTAFFDLESRTITLPTYDFLGKAEQQMLASHEVAHAKFSNYSLDDFQKYVKKFGSLFNIIEDIYVEQCIKRAYPGLSKVFSEAYKSLYENNFFKLGNRTAESFHFYDRINLFFKIGHVFPVNFSQKESEYVVRCYQLTSNDDVVKLCADIMKAFNNENAELQNDASKNKKQSKSENGKNGESAGSADDSVNGSEEGENASAGQSSGHSEEKQTSADSEEKQGSNRQSEEQNNTSSSDDSNGYKEGSNGQSSGHSEEKQTSANSDEKGGSDASSAAKNEGNNASRAGETMEDFDNALKEALKKASSKKKEIKEHFGYMSATINVFTSNNASVYDNVVNGIPITEKILSELFTNSSKELVRFIKTMNKDLDFIKRVSKDGDNYFQMLRNAKKAKSVRRRNTGSLDYRRLAKYKTSETIFKRKAIVTHETNHGVVLFIDFSTSIKKVTNDIINQAIVTCEFCKRNNIKFEVFLFGAYNKYTEFPNRLAMCEVVKIADNEHYMPEYLYIYNRKFSYFFNHSGKRCFSNEAHKLYFNQGKTPILRSAIVAFYAVQRMKARGCDKTHIVFITDGDNTDKYINMSWTSTDDDFKRRVKEWNSDGISVLLEKSVSYKTPSTVFVNGCAYDAIPESAFYDSVINAIFKHIKEMYGTEIMFSYIETSQCNRGFRLYSLVKTAIIKDINEKIYNLPADTRVTVFDTDENSFADSFIYQECPKTISQKNNSNNALEELYYTNSVLSVFVKELAKKIA